MHMCGPSFQKKEVIELIYGILNLPSSNKMVYRNDIFTSLLCALVKTKFENSVSVSYDNYCPVSVKMEKGRG